MVIPVSLLIGAGFYFINKPNKSLNRTKPDLQITALELFQAFNSDEIAANQSYLDKVIIVSGQIREVHEGNVLKITLNTDHDMFGIICEFDPDTPVNRADYFIGKEVSIKGLCTGMLMDVVMTRCVPNSK